MITPTYLRNLTSANTSLVTRSADLNALGFAETIAGFRPLARFVDSGDIDDSPAPAWYLPETRAIFIDADKAHYDYSEVTLRNSDRKSVATVLGLLAHECGHAAISDAMTPVQIATPHHSSLLSLFEELRVEAHAMRAVPHVRKYLRASFALILANLPEEFENTSHVVRAWSMVRGRTLAGIADADETNAVDVAARTLLGDDTVDALTDLLQEALTIPLDDDGERTRIVEICDEWHELVGEPAEHTGCTTCVTTTPGTGEGEGTPTSVPPAGSEPGDEGDDGEGGGGGKPDEKADDEADGGAGTGDKDDGGDQPDEGKDGDADGGEVTIETAEEFTWGKPGAADPAEDSDDHNHTAALSDEDAELMKALTRDLNDLMQDEWSREPAAAGMSNSWEWATKVFGNRKKSTRLTFEDPSIAARQHVVTVAAVLSDLALPAIAKVSKATVVPPGRMRSREALRASAERAQGQMVSAKPWKSTVRRHTNARPLVLGITTDTSGSMRWAEDGVAELAYVYANAGHRIGARTAAVTFGDHVQRIARPGEVLDQIVKKTASDGTEEFDKAMAALDGVLHLTVPTSAAKILIVVSDGAFVKGNMTDIAQMWLTAMDKAGTHVVWITERQAGLGYWLGRAAKRLPRLTVRPAYPEDDSPLATRRARYSSYYRADGKVFDKLNAAALDAIRHDISA